MFERQYSFCAALLIAIGVGIYFVYGSYRSLSDIEDEIEKTPKLLIVRIGNDISAEDRSGETQVKNGLSKGGMIRLGSSNSDFEYSLGNAYKSYGASNAEGTFWTLGAVLNYIASRGWTLVQAPSGLYDYYFFVQ